MKIKGDRQLVNGEIRIWGGKQWNCRHNRQRQQCPDCRNIRNAKKGLRK